MSLLLQISDPHFGTERPMVVAALLRLIDALPSDLVIVSGDITQRARQHQFAAARAFFDTLGVTPMVVVPGNHDIPLFDPLARLFYPYRNHQRAFGEALEPSFESGDLLVLGVNTTHPYRHTDGEVSMQQIRRVAAGLEAARPLQLRVVITHQPVVVTRTQDEKNLLRGHDRAVPRGRRSDRRRAYSSAVRSAAARYLRGTAAPRVGGADAPGAVAPDARHHRQFGERDSLCRRCARARRVRRTLGLLGGERAFRTDCASRTGARRRAATERGHVGRMTSSANPVAASVSRV